jgi:hypothetical protein
MKQDTSIGFRRGRPPGTIEDSTVYAKAAKLFTAQLVADNLEPMLRAQIRKAIDESDTAAFIAVMDRAHGKPKESVEVFGIVKAEPLTEEQRNRLDMLLLGMVSKGHDENTA